VHEYLGYDDRLHLGLEPNEKLHPSQQALALARRVSDGRLLVAEGFKEGIGESRGVKGLLRKVRDGLLDLDSVQRYCPL
jgi:hypothetical protein